MHAHGVLFLSVVIVWCGALLSLLVWGSWRWAATWAASAGLTGFAAWLHGALTGAMTRQKSMLRRERGDKSFESGA